MNCLIEADEAMLMNTLNKPSLYKTKQIKNEKKTFLYFPHVPPDLALWLALSCSKYQYLEQIFKVVKMFEPCKFVCQCMGPVMLSQNMATVLTRYSRDEAKV